MYAAKDLPDIHPQQKQTIYLDMGPALLPGENLQGSPTVTLEVVTGTDPTPNAHIVGGPTIGTAPVPQGSGVVNGSILVTLQGLLNGVRYKIIGLADVNNGDILPLEAYVNCRA